MNVHQNARLTRHSRAELVRRVLIDQQPRAVVAHKRMACAGCQTTISLHSAELVSEIKRVENMLDDFARAGRRH